jgi:hypothetical protein
LNEYLKVLKANGNDTKWTLSENEVSSTAQRSQYWRAKNWLNKKIKGSSN